MDFIEREKLRIEEEQKKKDAEEKAKEDLAKKKELELQKKRDSIYKEVGPFMEQLLQKTIEKQKQAEAEELPDPIEKLHHSEEKFKGWKWEIDWEDTTPRLWGHFESIEGYREEEIYEEDEKSTHSFCNGNFDDQGISTRFHSYYHEYWNQLVYWTIYIKCLVDVDKIALNITAKSEKYSNTHYLKDDRDQDSSKSLQAPYLENKGLIIPITKDASLIDKIADLLIEIRYTWKCQLAEQINKSITIIKLESSLKLYDKIIREKNEKLEIIKKKKEKDDTSSTWSTIIGITAGIIFLIWIMHDKAGFFSIIGNLIVGCLLSVIVFFIILTISRIIFMLFNYGQSTQDVEKDSLIIKNCETKINHKNSEISDLLKNIRATMDNDNIDKFVGDEIVLEFPLTDEMAESEHYSKKDFTSKIESMIKRSKYEEKSN